MLTAFLAAAAAAALPAPACRIDRAVYRLNADPAYTAGFARQDRRKVSLGSDLVFWLKTPGRTYWFYLASPNGYGGTYIAPDIDPRAAAKLDDEAVAARPQAEPALIPLDAFRPNLEAYPSPPQSSDSAPALLFARGLGPELWYEPARLSGGDESAAQESMPVGLFQPAGCGGPPAPALK